MIPLSDENPTKTFAGVTLAIIALCAAAFLWELGLGARLDEALVAFGFTPAAFTSGVALNKVGLPVWATIFTAMFLHSGWLHIGGNMLFLWIFGNNIEDAMGHFRFTIFYLVCGVSAAMAMVLLDPHSNTPMIGASGAISGVLAAYMLLYPRARVRTLLTLGFFFYVARLRAVWVVGIWFAIQLLTAAMTPPSEPGTAWWAHVGGFAAGLLLTPLFKSRDVRYFGPHDPRGPWADG